LKLFSARMEAKNFGVEELADLVGLAHARGSRVFVALNTLVKRDELTLAGRLLDQLNRQVRPDAVIVQDLAMAQLVRQTGFAGEVIWSTLANVTFPAALAAIRRQIPIDSLVLPRELTIDEVKSMAAACPPELGLEVFVHGALCYGVSGRCYWSSFMGGKSGLRGRCVQPCRRVYAQDGKSSRLFSCLDLSVDVLVKVLLGIPQIRAWKIEGRKKGPHYVYYIVTGYRLLRDHFNDPKLKKDALQFIAQALGRPGTHYYFLPQRVQNPIDAKAQTGSGLFIGRVKGAAGRAFIEPQIELLAGDRLRIGYEDEPGHRLDRMGRSVPKGGRHFVSPGAGSVPKGTPVFLVDRREKALDDLIQGLESELPARGQGPDFTSAFEAHLPKPVQAVHQRVEMQVTRRPVRGPGKAQSGVWLGAEALAAASDAFLSHAWWWLPPVIFPDEEAAVMELIEKACSRGGRRFVLNAPWQAALFSPGPQLQLWAGPFCNLANPLALETAARMGFTGAIVSPELVAGDYLKLPSESPLPLGIVIGGSWPLCVARPASEDLALERPFSSPKGEEAWAARNGPLVWVFPNWRLDLSAQKESLEQAGYRVFVQLVEPVPQAVTLKNRPGLWNWGGRLE
jgi:putative protease